jgi:(2S)-methylsuccinyl-CoA dehydrogenase
VTSDTVLAPDLMAAADATAVAQGVVDSGIAALRAAGGPDQAQLLAYDVSHAAAAVRTAESVVAYGAHGDTEARIACAFVADALAELAARIVGRSADWGVAADWMAPAEPFVAAYRHPAVLGSLAEVQGDRHLDPDFELVRDTFHRFADEQIRPRAEHIHRANTDIPEEIISGMAQMGGFGMSVPEEYGGFAAEGEADYLSMVVATEELTRAIVKGGTEEQKQHWLPKLATAEVLGAVAVTEPDYGSDVAGVMLPATKVDGGWILNGVKTWCTFAARANVLLLLARTDPDKSKGHKGLSIFLVEKPQADGHGFTFSQRAGEDGRPADSSGKMEGRAIDTLGYRGMHSYEISLETWFVPDANLIGGESGLGQGFYLQMQGFENGRLQTAARAVGLMQAAYEAAVEYAANRVVFGAPIAEYELTKVKLARMAVLIQASRQFAYEVARLMSKGEGVLEASMIKAYVCRTAEWVTREALQIHGGMGYAEEYAVSRYFVDARVLSIFEGADETLCLKVIARRLLAEG